MRSSGPRQGGAQGARASTCAAGTPRAASLVDDGCVQSAAGSGPEVAADRRGLSRPRPRWLASSSHSASSAAASSSTRQARGSSTALRSHRDPRRPGGSDSAKQVDAHGGGLDAGRPGEHGAESGGPRRPSSSPVAAHSTTVFAPLRRRSMSSPASRLTTGQTRRRSGQQRPPSCGSGSRRTGQEGASTRCAQVASSAAATAVQGHCRDHRLQRGRRRPPVGGELSPARSAGLPGSTSAARVPTSTTRSPPSPPTPAPRPAPRPACGPSPASSQPRSRRSAGASAASQRCCGSEPVMPRSSTTQRAGPSVPAAGPGHAARGQQVVRAERGSRTCRRRRRRRSLHLPGVTLGTSGATFGTKPRRQPRSGPR